VTDFDLRIRRTPFGKALNIVAEDGFVDFEIRHLEGDDVDTTLAGIETEVASRIAP
jgi:hypothetical protein